MSNSNSSSNSIGCKVELVHHGAAASSQPKTVCWLKSDQSLMYSSQGILNVALDVATQIYDTQQEEHEISKTSRPNILLMHVDQTLRTTIPVSTQKEDTNINTTESRSNDSRPIIITAVSEILPLYLNQSQDTPFSIVATTLSDGSIHIWLKTLLGSPWKEYIVPHVTTSSSNSNSNSSTTPMNCVHGKYMIQSHQTQTDDGIHCDSWSIVVILFTACAQGVHLVLVPLPTLDILRLPFNTSSSTPQTVIIPTTHSFLLGSYMATSLLTQTLISSPADVVSWDSRLLLISGTASPKGNRIHVHSLIVSHPFLQHYHLLEKQKKNMDISNKVYQSFVHQGIIHHGSLLGHLDWISCLDFGTLPRNTISTNNVEKDSQDWVLASGSHDTRIRLWRFHMPSSSSSTTSSPTLLEEELSNLNLMGNIEENDVNSYDGDEDDDEKSPIEDWDESEARLYIPLTTQTSNPSFMDTESSWIAYKMPITLEAVLMGHEGRVTSVSWRPRKGKNISPCLLSASMDRSILLWMEERGGSDSTLENSEGMGVWVPISRVGSAGGILGGSIGSTLLGYVDATFSPCSNFIVGHAYGGSLHFWVSSERFSPEEEEPKDNEIEVDAITRVERWTAAPSITGHFRGVSDISWEASHGSYLLSVSADQTCRLWSCIWDEDPMELWREVARPQVHGYDLNNVASIGDGRKEPLHRFVSGAEEKEIRAFDAPLASLRILNVVQGDTSFYSEEDHFEERVERAFVPALGLSNRYNIDDAMDENDGSGHGGDSKNVLHPFVDSTTDSDDTRKAHFSRIMNALPYERDLGVISVWPEFRKLFGHQSEVICLATGINHLGVILASSCKSRDIENASIRLWDVNRGGCIDILKGHKSTVVTLSFSSDGLYLASAGKDRRLCLWRIATDGVQTKSFLSSAIDIAHKRIIWSVHFSPTEPKVLASGSRDGTVKIWIVSELSDCTKLIEKSKFEPFCRSGKKVEPVTAVAFSPKPMEYGDGDQRLLLAVGVEAGLIELWSVQIGREINESIQSIQVDLLQSIPIHFCHFDSVKRLLWKPSDGTEEKKNDMKSKLALASCSSDHGVRIFNIFINGFE